MIHNRHKDRGCHPSEKLGLVFGSCALGPANAFPLAFDEFHKHNVNAFFSCLTLLSSDLTLNVSNYTPERF
jgi:hypothetical protein